MDLLLNEDEQMLREAARNFCQKHTPISQLRKLRDDRDALGFERGAWQQMVALGWTGMALPEAYGGFEFGHAGLGIVLQETGRTLSSSPLIASILLAATAIDELGSDSQKQSLLPGLIAGESLFAMAIEESAHHDPAATRLRARAEGDEFLLEGEKFFVLDGHIADKILVLARRAGNAPDMDGLAFFLVDAGQAGVKIIRTHMVDSRNAARLQLSGVRVPASARLGGDEPSDAGLERVLDIARIGVAAEMLGSIEEMFRRTVDYLNQREQFGVLIGAFQGLQHRAAEMYSEIELCRSAVLAALRALDDPGAKAEEVSRLASLTKAKLCESSELVSNEAIQMHGGIGMTDEFDIGFFIKRARVAQQFLGDGLYHRGRFATLSGY